MRKIKILEKEKMHNLYKELIKEEQVVDFKTKMIKLQHILSNMFESKREGMMAKMLEANMTPAEEAEMVERQIESKLDNNNVIRFHEEVSLSKGKMTLT
jgi:hypothetical protein